MDHDESNLLIQDWLLRGLATQISDINPRIMTAISAKNQPICNMYARFVEDELQSCIERLRGTTCEYPFGMIEITRIRIDLLKKVNILVGTHFECKTKWQKMCGRVLGYYKEDPETVGK